MRQEQFKVFKKFMSDYLFQIAQEIKTKLITC